jgi:L-arabinokinase
MKPIFEKNATVYTGIAPGRLDVMGGIADYSGSLVLQMPISQTTKVQVAIRHDGMFSLHSDSNDERVHHYQIHLSDITPTDNVDYIEARNAIKAVAGGHWAIYCLGAFLVLAKECGIKLTGADVKITGKVPLGKGVSSSAALEMATLKALAEAYQLTFEGTELARLGQLAENRVVGAPCGLMDQLASYHGKHGTLLPITCQPDILHPLLALPKGVHLVGIDSGVRHSVGGASYGDVRTAAFMGYSIIAQLLETKVEVLEAFRATGDSSKLPYGGYLANISPSDYEMRYRSALPDRIYGRDFIARYKVSTDTVTTIDPAKEYRVKVATRHPIYENYRTSLYRMLLERLSGEDADRKTILWQLGELMYLCHASYNACHLGSSATDELVERVKIRQKKGHGVYGAKITGGGSGGTVVVLCDGDLGLETAHNIAKSYGNERAMDLVFFD